MLKKTAIAAALAMVAGTGLAADKQMSHDQMSQGDHMDKGEMSHDQMSQGDHMDKGEMSHDQMGKGDHMGKGEMSHDQMGHQDSMGHDNMGMKSNGGGSMQIGMDTGMSVGQQFNALDSNGDGVISRSEARQSARLSSMYDSFNTGATIENPSRNSSASGITRAQFEAGLEAASHGGIVGPAVSGGQTHAMAEDHMGQGDHMGKDSMGHDQMGKGDHMGKDSMSHDQMGKGDHMGEDSMSHDQMSQDKMKSGDHMDSDHMDSEQ